MQQDQKILKTLSLEKEIPENLEKPKDKLSLIPASCIF